MMTMDTEVEALQAATARFMAGVERIEVVLKKLAVGICVSVETTGYGKEHGVVAVGYRRCGGKWQLFIERDGGDVVPLIDAKRSERIIAVPYLRDVIIAVRKEGVVLCGALDNGAHVLESLADGLESAP